MAETHFQQRIQTLCLIILAVVATGAALFWLKSVFIPFVLALFFTSCLSPVIDVQCRKLKLPRWLAVITTILLGLVILAFLGMLITSSAGEISEQSSIYKDRINELMNAVSAILPLQQLGIAPEQLSESILDIIPLDTVTGLLSSMLSGTMSVVSNGILVVIFMMFLIIGQKNSHPHAGGILSEVESRIKKYILNVTLVSGATGFLVGATLAILGVEFAWIFGLLAFLLNFIPNIGSIIATILPLPVALLNPELSILSKTLVIIIPGLIQFAMGNVVQPKIMGESLDLHPVVILQFLIFFGMIWGIVGMFLATPIAAVVKIVLSRFEYTAPIADVLAGRLDTLSSPGAPRL
ncbi:MAG: AI-2E family transporter [FCB group bacterium]|nr:AI-2E family transporter [FCB group bacterium]